MNAESTPSETVIETPSSPHTLKGSPIGKAKKSTKPKMQLTASNKMPKKVGKRATAVSTPTTRAALKPVSVKDLLSKLAATQDQQEKKRIRRRLRAANYWISQVKAAAKTATPKRKTA